MHRSWCSDYVDWIFILFKTAREFIMIETEDLKRTKNKQSKSIIDDPFIEANEAWVKKKKSIMDLVKEFTGTKKRTPFFKWLTDK